MNTDVLNVKNEPYIVMFNVWGQRKWSLLYIVHLSSKENIFLHDNYLFNANAYELCNPFL